MGVCLQICEGDVDIVSGVDVVVVGVDAVVCVLHMIMNAHLHYCS